MPMLALTTRGRRSGRPRAVQLACIGHEAHPDVEVPVRDERVAMGLSTTAFRLVNAVPLVCEAPDPGIKTFLDLPMITGCMGTHAIPR
jgi:hypothetical protein